MSSLFAGTTLVCIDMQEAVLSGVGADDQAAVDHAFELMLARVARVQAEARRANIAVIHVQHDGAPGHRLARGGRGWHIRPEVAPHDGERVIHKRSCDAFHETELADATAASRHLVIAGCMTQYCIDTTCRRAVSLGYDVTLVADGHMNAGSAGLTFAQVIAHHNAVLDGFDAGGRVVRVVSSRALFAAS